MPPILPTLEPGSSDTNVGALQAFPIPYGPLPATLSTVIGAAFRSADILPCSACLGSGE
jgi:hypothetical protein